MHSVAYGYTPIACRDVWTLNENRGLNYELRNRDVFAIPTGGLNLLGKFRCILYPMNGII
jgi:hypothetical protein